MTSDPALRYDGQSTTANHKLTDRVDFAIYVTEADLAPNALWPPLRFAQRDARLAMLDAFWRGDLSDFGIADVANVNYFHSYSTKLANLLIMSSPMVGPPPAGDAADPAEMRDDQPAAPDPGEQPEPEDERLDLTDGAYDALIDMTRYGAALMAVTDDQLEIIDPLFWYPSLDGGAYTVIPFTSAEATRAEPDRARVRYYPPDDGTGILTTRVWQSGRLGDLVADEMTGEAETAFDTTGIVIAQRTPRIGIWGTATYLEIASPIIEINRRGAANSDLLDAYAGPIPKKTMAKADAEARWPAQSADDVTAPTEEEKLNAVIDGIRAEFHRGAILLRDEVEDVDFLQPQTQGVMTAISQMDEMKLAIQSLTGLPSLTGEYQPPSGEALKRIFLPFYAESSALQKTLKLAFEQLFDEEVVWEHIFDLIEAEGRQRLMENAQMFAPRDDGDDEEDDGTAVE